STFSVAIPFGHAHLPAEQLQMETDAAVPAASHASAFVEEARQWSDDVADFGNGSDIEPAMPQMMTMDMPRATVLVVDDNADMRRYLQRLLHPHCKVLLAANGREALQLALEHAPDL